MDRIVSGVFRLATRNIPRSPSGGSDGCSTQAATILIAQLAAWVVRLAGADVANLLASWLVIPRIASSSFRVTAAGRPARDTTGADAS